MPRRSIYQTVIGQATAPVAQLEELAQFLIHHRDAVLSPGEARALVTAKSYTATPVGNVFSRAVELGKDKNFCFVRIPTGLAAPEIITLRHLTFDVRQMAAVNENLFKALNLLPEYNDKIVVNVTPLVTQAGGFSDLPAFQADLVRDLLSRSYFSSDRTWISPAIAQYLSKVYTMSLSATLAQVFDLTLQDELMVRTLFCFYYLQLMSDAESAATMMRANTRNLSLGSPNQVADLLDLLRRELGGPDASRPAATHNDSARWYNPTLDDICQVAMKLGISRLKVDRRLIYTRMNKLGPDIHTSMLAIEYPPYWAYLALMAASGRKIGLSFTLKKADLLRPTTEFADDLTRATGFYSSI